MGLRLAEHLAIYIAALDLRQAFQVSSIYKQETLEKLRSPKQKTTDTSG